MEPIYRGTFFIVEPSFVWDIEQHRVVFLRIKAISSVLIFVDGPVQSFRKLTDHTLLKLILVEVYEILVKVFDTDLFSPQI